MCHLHRKDWGVIASTEGLATGYPVIAGTRTGAKLAYSYGGAGKISGGRYPAFPGEPWQEIRDIKLDVLGAHPCKRDGMQERLKKQG